MISPPASPTDLSCPSCSAVVPTDPRFVTWCPSCDWNVDPSAAGRAEDTTPTRAARRKAARRRADRLVVERLYAEVAGASQPHPGRDRSWLGAMTVAGSVHLVTVALFGASLWLLVAGNAVTAVLGAIGLVVAVMLRPRLGRLRADEWVVSRAQAPNLHALADRVATEVGAPQAHLIRVTPQFNASYGRVGLRRRSILTLGLALWEVLTPQERIALLGHEFGHAVNGDTRRGLWLGSALVTLSHWCELTRPTRTAAADADMLFLIAGWIAHALMVPPHMLARLALRLLDRLSLRTGQRAEYLADDLAARVGSSAAAQSMLGTLVLGESVEALFRRQAALRRKRRRSRAGADEPDDFGLWQELREYITSVPGTERTRRLRLSELRMSAVDTSHPPTHLRVRLVDARTPREAAISADAAETAAIEAELADSRARAARDVFSAER